jgi:hypothetical protein
MHAERFLQRSVPNVPLVQCSSQMSAPSTGVCTLETLSSVLKRTPIFTKSRRETQLTLLCGLQCSVQLFTDECTIYRSVHSRNIVFCAKGNPHFYEEQERNPAHVIVWAALSATHMFGPFLSHGSVSGHAYHNMLSELLVPQLQQAAIKNAVVRRSLHSRDPGLSA